jgi:hypothetical protein
MDFKAWFNEVIDVENLPTNQISFQRKDNRYTSSFEVDGDFFTVEFSKQGPKSIFGEYINGHYDLVFEGPNNFSTTGKGSKQYEIYTNVLLIIKKFFETKEVNILSFGAYEPAMALVYNRFFKKYLAQDFIQVDEETYVRKSVLKNVEKTKDPAQVEPYYKDIFDSRRKLLDRSRDLRKEKTTQRQNKNELLNKIKSEVGRVVLYKNFNSSVPALILEPTILNGAIRVKVLCNKYQDGLKEYIAFFELLDSTSPINQNKLNQFFWEITQSPYKTHPVVARTLAQYKIQ